MRFVNPWTTDFLGQTKGPYFNDVHAGGRGGGLLYFVTKRDTDIGGGGGGGSV